MRMSKKLYFLAVLLFAGLSIPAKAAEILPFSQSCPAGMECAYTGAVENGTVTMACASPGSAMSINNASYGAGGSSRSCTDYVNSICSGKSNCTFDFSNGNCGGDPDYGVVKSGSASMTCDPKGLFTVGTQAYFSNGQSMCSFTSTSQVTDCGYSQIELGIAPSMSLAPQDLKNTGSCTCSAQSPWNVKPGLFRIGWSALYSDGATACGFPTWDSFTAAGFDQYQYDNARQLAATPPQLAFTGTCQGNPWSGPTTKIAWVDGRPKFSINGTNYDPLYLAVTPADVSADWTADDSELINAKNSGIPVVHFNLGWTGWDPDIETYAKHLKNGPYYISISAPTDTNWYPAIGMAAKYNANPTIYMNTKGQTGTATNYDSFNDGFMNYSQEVVQNIMRRMDQLLPGRIIGYKTNEQFEQVMAMQPNNTLASSASMLTSYFPNYDAETQNDFCNWVSLPAILKSYCSKPTPAMRNLSNYGDNFIQASNIDTALGINYNMFFASHYASLLGQYGQATREASGSKALTGTYYGYTNALTYEFAASGHAALQEMEKAGLLDMIGGPYSYADSRNLGTDLRSSGVSDSAALYDRLYVYEDDPITYFCNVNPTCYNSGFFSWYQNQASSTLEDTLAFMRRDFVSAAVHKTGLYLLDLVNGRSYGSATMPTETAQFWAGISQDLQTASKVSFTTQHDYEPQVAVFVDEASMLRQPLTGSSTSSDEYTRQMNSTIGSLEELNKAGVVYRQYLLTDLLSDTISLDNINCAIFLNAYQVTPAVQAAIKTKLQKNGKALVYIYASGLFAGPTPPATVDTTLFSASGAKVAVAESLSENLLPASYAGTALANAAYMTKLTGIDIARGNGALAGPITTQIEYPIDGVTPAPFGMTDGNSLNPWFYVNDPQAVSLGHYTNNNLKSLVWKGFTGYSVFYSALPMIPATFYRSIAQATGSHLFTDHLMDEVEAGGNTLVVNVKDTQTRTISLPFTVSQIVEDRNGTTTVKCTNCSEFTVENMVGPESYVYRWQ